jgi:hypothetical protein
MTEQEKWLSELTCGNEVAVRDRPVGGFMGWELGWRVYTIYNITPKRSRFDLMHAGGVPAVSMTSRSISDMHPVTEEIRESIRQDTRYIRARNKAEMIHSVLGKALAGCKHTDWTGATLTLESLLEFLKNNGW